MGVGVGVCVAGYTRSFKRAHVDGAGEGAVRWVLCGVGKC